MTVIEMTTIIYFFLYW